MNRVTRVFRGSIVIAVSFSVSGSGSITWTGDDQIGDVSISGSGSVKRY